MESTTEQAAVFAALADPTRLKLLKLLSQSREFNAFCVNALAGMLEVSQSAVSQHLRVLKSVGLVSGKRMGYHIHYSVNPEAFKKCQEMISSMTNLSQSQDESKEEKNVPGA